MLTAVDAATHPTPGALKQLGYAGVVQYLAGKDLTATYLDRCKAAGLPLISAWELTPQAALGGGAQGSADAAAAVAAAKSFGQPKGTCIYAAVDFEPEGAQMTAVVAYAEAWAAGVRAAGYLAGLYGGLGTIKAVRAKVDRLWQTLAWSTGAVAEGIALYQNTVNVSIAGVPCDTDEVLATPGAWSLSGPVYLFGPPTEEDTVAVIAIGHMKGTSGPTGLFVVSSAGKLHIPTDADAEQWEKAPFSLKRTTALPVAFVDGVPEVA